MDEIIADILYDISETSMSDGRVNNKNCAQPESVLYKECNSDHNSDSNKQLFVVSDCKHM
jgi:hypothetical protein